MEIGMLISVVIPVYNKRKSIRNTLTAVLNQTYSDFEVLVIDDGSKDGSMDEIADFDDSKLRIILKMNTGVSDTRNLGMREAKGDIVAFLDGDDLWDNFYLQRLADMIQKYPDCSLYMQNSIDIPAEEVDAYRWEYNQNKTISRYTDWEHYFYFRNFKTSALAVNKKDALQLGGFDTSLTIGEDLDLWLRLILSGPVCFLDEIHVLILKYSSDYHSRFVPEDYRKHLSYKLATQKNIYLELKDNKDVRHIMNKMIFHAWMSFSKDKNKEAVNRLRPEFRFNLLFAKDKIKYVLFKLHLWQG